MKKSVDVFKNSGSGKKTTSGDDIEVSSPPSSGAVNVIHVSHSDGTSVSTIVRRLEEKLQDAVPQPQQQRSNGMVAVREQLQAADGSIPSPPPTPTNSGSHKKSNKLMAKIKKSSGANAPVDFIMSSPSNFQHNAHVDNDYNWGPDPQKVLKLGAVLGQGAYGQVLEAQYINTNYLMALKIIPMFAAGKNVDDVSREINVLRRCRHPNIVSYYGSATTASELWIMMEYCAHGSLGSIVDTFKAVDKQLTERQLAYILHQAITGLAYLHNDQIKVIHRDLKCGNILMGEDGIVKLADFGISFQQTGSRSKAATMIGTPLFMSPEMLSGDPYNAKADIWSLGITTIEMADGVPPYFKDHQMRALFRIMHEDPPTLAEPHKWSPQFVSFVEACLQKEPSERPSALALLEHEFLRQVTPEETKAVMKNLLTQYEDARREVQRRKAEKNGVGDLCLNFGLGCGGGGLTTLSTEVPGSFTDASSRAGGSSGLTTLDAPEEVVKLRSLTPRNGVVDGNADDESSSSDDGDDESRAAKKNATAKAKAKSSSAEGGATDDAEDAPTGSAKKSKRKSAKVDKKSKRKSLKAPAKKNSLDPHHTTTNTVAAAMTTLPSSSSKALSPPVDRRSTLSQMHGNQSSMAFFTGLRQGAQQLLSGAPQAPPQPLPDDGTTAPRTIEEHLRGEDATAAGAALAAVAARSSSGSSEPASAPKTMAELARVVGDDLDDYLAMPLVQLIYELHLHRTKQGASDESGSSSSVKTRKW